MSGWRILVRSLHELGRPAPLRDFDDFTMNETTSLGALCDARERGLIVNAGSSGRRAIYALTPLGKAWAQGRAMEYAGAHPIERRAYLNTNGAHRHRVFKQAASRGLKFCATWLAALPQGVRI